MDDQHSTTLVVREVDVSRARSDDTSKPGVTIASSGTTETAGKTTPRSDVSAAKPTKEARAKASAISKAKKTKKRRNASHAADSDSTDSDSTSSSSSSSDSDHSSESEDECPERHTKASRGQKRSKKAKPKRFGKSQKPADSSSPDLEPTASEASDSDMSDVSSHLGRSTAPSSESHDGRTRGRHGQRKDHRKRPHSQSHLMQYQPPPLGLNVAHPAPMQYYPATYGAPYGTPMGSPYAPGLGPAYVPTMANYAQPPRRSPPPPASLNRGSGRNRGQDLPGSKEDRPCKSGRRQSFKSTDFKRVDQVWDGTIHDYKLQDTAECNTDLEYEGYLFHVRRTFDWEGKYKQTLVDIKSKLLREVLQDVMGEIKGVSLVEDVPKLDPNMLFLYLEDMRAHVGELKKAKPKGDSKKARKKEKRRNKKKRKQLNVMIKYLDMDYESVKSSLIPMLDNGIITFDLMWALWKPNTLAYTTTYGSQDHPRVFKARLAEKHCTFAKGAFYYIEGKYFEYDGKRFGYGRVADEICAFRGVRKITSLPVYPLKYHSNEEALRKELIERGKAFVALSGVQYRSYEGMAYFKKKRSMVKVNIKGRIMVDSSTHRRINPNYPISIVRSKGRGHVQDSDVDSDDTSGRSDSEAASGDERGRALTSDDKLDNATTDSDGNVLLTDTSKGGGDSGKEVTVDREGSKALPVFSDEEYLMASPMVLGFAFAEKLWLEFAVSDVKDIQWNEAAYESLVLEPKTKDIVKALVESHKYHAAESIDDVIQGKGKGLVAVLHGPPGTGKTLTAEGISELLKCPLYMVSAGELGTDSRVLEVELQRILDICHAWGSILLLDEADVFLEKRNMQDIHRNALVSIFLRQLEYFQGILFLTTNRVETFDDAFQSRIHIALRYDSLDHRAKKAIFKIFIERVRVLEKIDLMPFTDEDYNALARHDMNGRQIKNTVRTAQALAVNKSEPLSMVHIRQVLDVHMSFARDLKGGPGFQDAMRSYF